MRAFSVVNIHFRCAPANCAGAPRRPRARVRRGRRCAAGPEVWSAFDKWLRAPAGLFRLGLGRRGDRAWFDDLEQSGLNGVVDPQAAEGDAARLAIIEQAPVAYAVRFSPAAVSMASAKLDNPSGPKAQPRVSHADRWADGQPRSPSYSGR